MREQREQFLAVRGQLSECGADHRIALCHQYRRLGRGRRPRGARVMLRRGRQPFPALPASKGAQALPSRRGGEPPGQGGGFLDDGQMLPSRSQTVCPTSSASAPTNWYLQQIDHTIGAYRSTIWSQADLSPSLARSTRATTVGSSRILVPPSDDRGKVS